jgi:hypothetical protein
MSSSSSDSLSATPRGLGASGPPVLPIPEIPLKLVRRIEITANFHRCKEYFVKFCGRGRFRAPAKGFTTEGTEDHRGKNPWGWLSFPIFAVDHALDAISEMRDVEVDQESDLLAAQAHVGE